MPLCHQQLWSNALMPPLNVLTSSVSRVSKYTQHPVERNILLKLDPGDIQNQCLKSQIIAISPLNSVLYFICCCYCLFTCFSVSLVSSHVFHSGEVKAAAVQFLILSHRIQRISSISVLCRYAKSNSICFRGAQIQSSVIQSSPEHFNLNIMSPA